VDGEGKGVTGGKQQYTYQEQAWRAQNDWHTSNNLPFSINALTSVVRHY